MEDDCRPHRRVREPRLPRTPPVAHRLPVLRPVRPQGSASPGRRGLSKLTDKLAELGVEIDAQLFELSLTHRSYAYEAGGLPSNERLEFLGDAVLEIVVTEHIYLSYPDLAEGELAKLRSAVVSAVACARVARELEVGPMIRLGKGEIATGGHDKTSILADTMEAIIGAVHLSAGAEASARFVHDLFDPLIDESVAEGDYADHKTVLQELAAKRGLTVRYEMEVTGPDHDREFVATAFIGEEALGAGTGRSKRRAQQLAAREAVAKAESIA